MPDEKDRYGDKLRDLERAREDKFFADRDRDLVEKMRQQKHGKHGAGAAGAPQRCPKCGEALTATTHLDVTVEECPRCGGVWLDKGELAEIARRESNGWLARYLGRSR